MYDSEITWSDTLPAILAALFTAALAETLSYFLIYCKPEYIQLKKNIESLSKALEKGKDKFLTASKKKIHDKKMSKDESTLKVLNQQLSVNKMKSTFIIALFMIAVVSTLSSTYHGVVVAKLPFVPFGLIQGLTHRGLPGNDMTDCSMIFLYVLTSYIVRADIQKYFGFAPKTPFSMWNPPNQSLN